MGHNLIYISKSGTFIKKKNPKYQKFHSGNKMSHLRCNKWWSKWEDM